MRVALALAAALTLQAPATVRLQIRVFDGAAEVTAETRLVLYRAADRGAPVARAGAAQALDTPVPPGLYDAQAILEKDGRVVSIRWAERLVVMPYPDEAGRHLEVINFQSDYGALEVMGRGGSAPDAALFEPGVRDQPAARPASGDGYALFIAPAGRYDLRIGDEGHATWHAGIDVPRDRTRFWLAR